MSDQVPRHTDEAYYGFFMTALMGLEDTATSSGYSEEGTSYLRLAIDAFMDEARQQFPNFLSGK
jgi:hypothetical protein